MFAASLSNLARSAKPLYIGTEFSKSNLLLVTKGSRLRSQPFVIKSNLIKVLDSDKVYLFEYCKNYWCKLADKELYVYKSRLKVKGEQ